MIHSPAFNDCVGEKQIVVITDPPFNIGYHYNEYSDSMPQEEYMNMLHAIFTLGPSVFIHYPEMLYQIAIMEHAPPRKIVSWVYNSNTAKQHRDIAFFGITPDFSKVKQPYMNLNDKRVQQLIASGSQGANLYDWWNINQVKNISKEKFKHPCQMPQEVMDNIIGILPDNESIVVVDPFMGSGTTGTACIKRGVDFIGIELNETYFNIARQRIGMMQNNFLYSMAL